MSANTAPVGKAVMLDAVGEVATWLSLHHGDPSTTGANEIVGGSYARVQTTWEAADGSAGTKLGSLVAINVPAGVTVDHWGLWTAGSAGIYYDGGALPTSESFSGGGIYDLTPELTQS
jgi:hypothetical protein